MDKLTLYMPVIGRLLMSVVFLQSAYVHATHPDGTIGFIGKFGLPVPTAAFVIDLCIEIGGGLALILGFKLRWVGAILTLYCLFTAAVFHNNFSDANQTFNFVKNLCMAGGFLYVVTYGAGAFSFDNGRRAS